MKLSELIDHSAEEVQEMLSSPEPFSAFEDYGDFKLLLIRRIEFVSRNLGFRSEAYILKEKEVYFFDREKNEFRPLEKNYAAMLSQLESYYRNNQKILTAYSSQIEELEDFLYDRQVPSVFMDMWFDLKKDLSKLENYYYRNGIVYREFYKIAEPLFGRLKDEYKDIEDGIQFQASNITALKTRLDGVHHYYDSIKNDRMNKTLFTLTALSGIFLPLNLIVGFFGMNTPGLFFMEDHLGTEKVLVILLLVLLACITGIPILHLIDRYLLRWLLGRYDFYKDISSRLDELGERWRGK
ncbi:MAG: CorA family divalent cation transporter [Bdellovibrionales bacterium]